LEGEFKGTERFEIVSRLGAGGMGVVYRAYDHRRGAPIALKTLHRLDPASILRPEQAPLPLTTPARRADLLLALGVDAVCVQPADAALMALEAEAFYTDVLRGRFAARAVVEGQDFRFGARRRGDVSLLAGLCGRDAVDLEVVPPVIVAGEPVSSSRFRALVAAGRLGEARALMTSP
jgi:riboflavin kinase/FMN adenylyltransferase